MEDARKLTKLILDPATMEMINLAIKEGLYPSQIAERLNKSKSLVTKKLNELEGCGVIKSRFMSTGGSIVKKFELVNDEITVNVNFLKGEVRVSEKKGKEKMIKPSERVKELLR